MYSIADEHPLAARALASLGAGAADNRQVSAFDVSEELLSTIDRSLLCRCFGGASGEGVLSVWLLREGSDGLCFGDAFPYFINTWAGYVVTNAQSL